MNQKETLSIHEYRFTVVYEPAEEGGYVVTCPALSAVITQGETLEEARAMETLNKADAAGGLAATA